MVKGLERFREHFKEFTDKYILIGGSACDIAMEGFGENFRATKDLDIVLCVEALTKEFVESFWEFIKAGGYSNLQKSTGEKIFYRFDHPEDASYPFMLELFSRTPDALEYAAPGHLVPIPIEDEVSSLSAILLDDEYYDLIQHGKTVINHISFISPEYIIPLKTRAWEDMVFRKCSGADVSSSQIKKHRNDVFRIYRIINPELRVKLSESMKNNVRSFLDAILKDRPDLKHLGFRSDDLLEVIESMKIIYDLG